MHSYSHYTINQPCARAPRYTEIKKINSKKKIYQQLWKNTDEWGKRNTNICTEKTAKLNSPSVNNHRELLLLPRVFAAQKRVLSANFEFCVRCLLCYLCEPRSSNSVRVVFPHRSSTHQVARDDEEVLSGRKRAIKVSSRFGQMRPHDDY